MAVRPALWPCRSGPASSVSAPEGHQPLDVLVAHSRAQDLPGRALVEDSLGVVGGVTGNPTAWPSHLEDRPFFNRQATFHIWRLFVRRNRLSIVF